MSQKWKKKRCVEVSAALVGAACLAFMAIGCDRPDWDDPEYVAEMLEEGSGQQRLKAINQLNDFPEEERGDLAEAVSTAYMEDEALRGDIMQVIIEWRAPEAEEAYLEELSGDYGGYGAAAGEVLGEIGAEDRVPEMIEIFDEVGDNDRRIGILRGLAHIPQPEAIEQAVDIFEKDIDNYPIDLHRASCEFLGGLAADNPDVITDEAREAVIFGRFLVAEGGGDAAEECGMAIQQMGPDIVPQLTDLFHQENEEVAQELRRYSNPEEGDYHPQNRAKRRAVEHLGQLRAPEAVELFVDDLSQEPDTPDFDGDRLLEWMFTEFGVINEMVVGLGYIGDPEARPVLEEIATGEAFENQWEDFVRQELQFQILQSAPRALVAIGDREALPAILDIPSSGLTEDVLEAYQTHVEAYEEQQEDDDEEQEGRRIPEPRDLDAQFRPDMVAAKNYVYLADADHRDEYEEFVDDLREMFDEQGVDGEDFFDELEAYGAGFDVMDECEDIDDEGQKAECFQGFFDDDSEYVRNKAAYELSRLSPEAAGPVVAESIDTDSLETREVLTFAGYRAPTPELADNIEQVLESESTRTTSEYERDHRRLRMLHAWLQHNDEPRADAE